MLRKWEELPEFMKTTEVRPYWEVLNKRRGQLLLKRIFDLVVGIILLIILAIPMAIIAVMIKIDSKGSIFYRQERVTAYGKHFYIHKFRTMVNNAEKIGPAVTVENDVRLTKIGAKLRKYCLDEFPQLIDVILGDMSFVGTRPEVVKYVNKYKPDYYATLLMPAGITSEASIRYKDESRLLMNTTDEIDKIYLEKILPAKMFLNLQSIINFNIVTDIKTMFVTITAVMGKDKNEYFIH